MVTLNFSSQSDASAFRSDAQNISNQITGTDNADTLLGTSGDDFIDALNGNDIIVGTTGNDTLVGGEGFDTADYSDLGEAITVLTRGDFNNGSGSSQLSGIEKIIGATGQSNVIDASSSTSDTASIDVDLANNRATAQNIPGVGSIEIGVENFVDVIGTLNDDIITGSTAANNLTGGGGNDSLSGGSGKDRLTGTDSTIKGAGEQDNLVGGSGEDRFVLGDQNGSYYTAEGNNDFAKITDFSFGDIVELGRGGTYSVERQGSNINLFVQEDSGKELIANIKFSFSTSSQVTSKVSSEIVAGDSSDKTITLPSDSFQLDSGESLDIFASA